MTAVFLGLFAVIILPGGVSRAAMMSLDPAFGSGGRVSLGLGQRPSGFEAVIQQSDGKILAAGWTWGSLGQRLLLARFELDGTLDADFGNAGIVRGASASSVDAVIQQRDGKIVAAGGKSPWGTILLWRFNADGTPDPSFHHDGESSLSSNSGAKGLVQLANGKLVVAGMTDDFRIKLVRFHGNGAIDRTFGTDGALIVHQATYGSFPNGLLQQPDGKILIFGDQNLSDFGSDDSGVVLARVTADGDFDETFGHGGVKEIPLRSAIGGISGVSFTEDLSVALQDDGKIVIAGFAAIGGRFQGFALRLQGDGSLDPAFGPGGGVLETAGLPRAIEIAPDGTILTAMFTCSGSAYRICDIALHQRSQDGSVDDATGAVKADFGLRRGIQFSFPKAMTRLADGSLVIVGDRYPVPTNQSLQGHDLAIAKFHADSAFAGLIGLTGSTCKCSFDGEPVEFVVRRTGGSNGAVTVNFVTVDGSAKAGSDYVERRGRLHWEDGETRARKILLQTLDNPSTTPREFTLRLTNPTGGSMLTTGIATVKNFQPVQAESSAAETGNLGDAK